MQEIKNGIDRTHHKKIGEKNTVIGVTFLNL